jgi:opacity protein-like surface antigen
MNKTVRSLLLIAAGSLSMAMFTQPGHSQNFYFDADMGVALADDVKLRQFVVPTSGIDLELEPGMRLSVAGGYNFNDFVGVQLETGIIHNEVDNIDASIGHVPMLVNVVFRYDRPESKWVPYAGAGAGGDASLIQVDDVFAPNGTLVDGEESTVVFAWQLFAGVRYKLNDMMSIGAGYKFYSAEGASWDVHGTGGEIETGTADVHSFGVNFNMKF